jgi:hypothetical protein
MSETAATAAELKRGLVVTKDSIQIPGKKQVLELPCFGYEVSFSVADVRELPPEQFKLFAEEFRKHFNEQFAFLRRRWFADIRKFVRQIETQQLKPLGVETNGDRAAAVREMRPIVEQANADLRQRCTEFAGVVQQHGQSSYQAALRAAWRAAKRRSATSNVKVVAEFDLVRPLPPAVPIQPESRFVVMHMAGRR